MHRTAAGRMVDMEALRLTNEGVIAVGNMRTNARGDELGPGGRVVKTKSERMNEAYGLHTMVPKDDEVIRDMSEVESRKEEPVPAAEVKKPEVPKTKSKVEDPFKGGLANALAKTVKVAETPPPEQPKTSRIKRI